MRYYLEDKDLTVILPDDMNPDLAKKLLYKKYYGGESVKEPGKQKTKPPAGKPPETAPPSFPPLRRRRFLDVPEVVKQGITGLPERVGEKVGSALEKKFPTLDRRIGEEFMKWRGGMARPYFRTPEENVEYIKKLEEKGIVPRRATGEAFHPEAIASFVTGMATFLPTMAFATEDSIKALFGGTPSGEKVQDILTDWGKPYWDWLAHGDKEGILRKWEEDPLGVFVDFAILVGGMKYAGRKGYSGGKYIMSKRQMMAFEKEVRATIDKLGAGETTLADSVPYLKEVARKHGIDPDVVDATMQAVNQVAMEHSRTIEVGQNIPPETLPPEKQLVANVPVERGGVRIKEIGEEVPSAGPHGLLPEGKTPKQLVAETPMEKRLGTRRMEVGEEVPETRPGKPSRLIEKEAPQKAPEKKKVAKEKPPTVEEEAQRVSKAINEARLEKQAKEWEREQAEARARWETKGKKEGRDGERAVKPPEATKVEGFFKGVAREDALREMRLKKRNLENITTQAMKGEIVGLKPEGVVKGARWKANDLIESTKRERMSENKRADVLEEAADYTSLADMIEQRTQKEAASIKKFRERTGQKGAVGYGKHGDIIKEIHRRAKQAKIEREEGSARFAEEFLRDMKDPDGLINEHAAPSKDPKIAAKNIERAVRAEAWEPIEGSRLSGAAVEYMKDGDISKYNQNAPAHIGDITVKEAEKLPGVAKARKMGSAALTEDLNYYVTFTKGVGRRLKKFVKDIAPGEGEITDPTRIMQKFDGGENGVMVKKVKKVSEDGERARMRYVGEKLVKIEDIAERWGMTDKIEGEVFDILNGKEGKYSKNSLGAAKELRKMLDETIDEVNAARRRRGMKEIPYRKDYISWIAQRNLMDRLLGREGKPEWVIDVEGPIDLQNIERVFNPRELQRKAEYNSYVKDKRALKIIGDYAKLSGSDIFFTDLIQNTRVYADLARKKLGAPNFANFLEKWSARSFGHVKHPMDILVEGIPGVSQAAAFQRVLTRGIKRSVFAGNLPWNLLVQTTSHTQLAPMVGFVNMGKAIPDMWSPAIRKIVEESYQYQKKTAGPSQIAAEYGKELQGGKWTEREGKISKYTRLANIMTEFVERELSMHAGIAAYHHGKQIGLKGRALKDHIGETIAKVNSMYDFQNLPGILQSRNIVASLPFQTFAFEAMNNFREIVGGSTRFGTGAYKRMGQKRVQRLLKWAAGIYVANAMANTIIGRRPWEWESFIPFSSIFSDITGSSGGRYARGGTIVLIDFFARGREAAEIYIKTGQEKKLRSWLLRYVPTGTQANRMYETYKAHKDRGWVLTSRDEPLFKIADKEQLKAYFAGPWATEAAQDWLGRGGIEWEEKLPKAVHPLVPLVPGVQYGMQQKKAAADARYEKERGRKRYLEMKRRERRKRGVRPIRPAERRRIKREKGWRP